MNQNYSPLQKERKPSALYVLIVQSTTPLYGVSKRPAFNISSWFWTRSFTLSIGAAAVLEMIAAAPLSPKFSIKCSFFSLGTTFAIWKKWKKGYISHTTVGIICWLQIKSLQIWTLKQMHTFKNWLKKGSLCQKECPFLYLDEFTNCWKTFTRVQVPKWQVLQFDLQFLFFHH